MSKKLREQFEKETGEKADVYEYVVNPNYLKWLEQRQETRPHETIVKWHSIETPPEKVGWYLVATDDEWRRDFWDGETWHGQGKSKYTKYWADVKAPKDSA